MQLPNDWVLALRALHLGGFPEAVIAGGALRDLDNGREVKDIDIFVQYRGRETVGLLQTAFGYQFDVSTMLPAEITEYTENLADVSAIYNVKSDWVKPIGDGLWERGEDLPPIQVIALKEFQGLTHTLARIDLGLCQIGTADGEKIVRLPSYCVDKAARTMTVTRCESVGQLERTLKRFNRLSEKYSGFELVIPLEFQKYAPPVTV